MSRNSRPRPDPDKEALAPLPEQLLDDPLEYMLRQQVRLRAACMLMRQAATDGVISAAKAAYLARMLKQELVLHTSDEDFDLFPALLRRGTAEDALSGLINDLIEDGARLKRLEPQIIQVLEAPTDGGEIHIAPRYATLMRSYAVRQHRRLAAEHGILMAIARRRLSASDLKAMTRSMKRRRGIAT